jgi:hypothetical protein
LCAARSCAARDPQIGRCWHGQGKEQNENRTFNPGVGIDRNPRNNPMQSKLLPRLRSDAYLLDVFASAFIARNKFEISRRCAVASAVECPCLRAFLFPLGAPGEFPPCILQRPFGIAGDRHRLPFRVRAPHRRLRCMGDLLCIALIL